jgi:hypothetical protein
MWRIVAEVAEVAVWRSSAPVSGKPLFRSLSAFTRKLVCGVFIARLSENEHETRHQDVGRISSRSLYASRPVQPLGRGRDMVS